MIKRLFLAVSFLTLFLFTPTAVLAQPTNETPWSTFWSSISNIISSIGNLFNFIIRPYFQPSIVNNSQDNSNYNQTDKDMTTRSIPDSNREYNRGVYLKDVINGTIEDKTVGYICNNSCSNSKIDSNCTDIKLSTLAFYFYKRGDKKLYQSGNTIPIDYDSAKMESYKYTLISDDSCYENLYNNSSIIPSGESQGGDTAASSEQLNNVVKTPIPDSQQSQSGGGSSGSIVQQLINIFVTQTNENQKILFQNMIPQTFLDVISDNINNFKNSFADFLHPESWQSEDDTPDRSDDNSGSKTCRGHHRGMSQYGAKGMAMSGFDYDEILYSYFGGDELKVKLSNIDSSKEKITVALIESDSSCDSIPVWHEYGEPKCYFQPSSKTEAKKVCAKTLVQPGTERCFKTLTLYLEDYLKGLGEMPASWPLEAHKAQQVIARTYSYSRTGRLTNPIKNCSYDQVFRCSKMKYVLSQDNNQAKAADATKGQILLKDNSLFSTEYSSCHGTITETPPYFDGREYEKIAGIVIN